jgi:hypothetical protein
LENGDDGGKLLDIVGSDSGKGGVMRKWYVPLTIAGIGGLGVFLFTESGRRTLRWVGQYIRWNSEGFLEWNESAEAELQKIQDAVSALAEALQPRTELGG